MARFFITLNRENNMKDLHEEWTGTAYDNLPWAPDNKDEAQLLAEFKKEPPPMKRGVRIPYVLFLRVDIDRVPEQGQYKVYKRNRLHVLDCSGNHAQQTVINHYANKSVRLLHYWFPDKKTPEYVSHAGGYDTTVVKNSPEPIRDIVKLCERIKSNGINAQQVQTLTAEKASLEQKVKELKAEAEAAGKAKRESKSEKNQPSAA